nr:cupin domain-containing protein [Brachybacterium sp. ACRRE]
MRRTDGVTINTVAFSPGARTYWHSHENGQILQVQSGEGFVATDADGVRILRPGDTVWCPPGERHWHGASPDTFLVHVAISLGQTSWAEEVTQGEYEDGTKGRDENDR